MCMFLLMIIITTIIDTRSRYFSHIYINTYTYIYIYIYRYIGIGMYVYVSNRKLTLIPIKIYVVHLKCTLIQIYTV